MCRAKIALLDTMAAMTLAVADVVSIAIAIAARAPRSLAGLVGRHFADAAIRRLVIAVCGYRAFGVLPFRLVRFSAMNMISQ